MKRILLVDDDDLFRRMLALILTKLGYEVREACNGKEAIKLFDDSAPDVVLTDLIMPEKEGLETIAEIRQSHPHVKIIAMSGGGRVSAVDHLRVAKAMGADQILAKPFSNEAVAAALEMVLNP
ncbi:MAG: response regulator [Opitutaceae bacterium]|jgi:CheY-like chemotaxis protein